VTSQDSGIQVDVAQKRCSCIEIADGDVEIAETVRKSMGS
jgi:hypothetical protein